MTHRSWLALALALVACGGSPPPSGGTFPGAQAISDRCAGQPPVQLRFAWPSPLVAAVEGIDQTESQNADGTDPRVAESFSQLRMVADRDAGGPTVRFEVAGETRLRSQGFAPDVGGLRPLIQLGLNGAVRGVEGTDAMRARLVALVRSQQISEESFDAIAANLTLQRQLASAQSHWDWVLGVWNGRELRCGEPQRGRARVPGMSFSTADVEVSYELAYRGTVPCHGPGERGVAGGCVELVATQDADAGQVTAALTRFPRDGLERLMRGGGVADDRDHRGADHPDSASGSVRGAAAASVAGPRLRLHAPGPRSSAVRLPLRRRRAPGLAASRVTPRPDARPPVEL